MKMDRNLNPDGRGKYALIKLREVPLGWLDKPEHFHGEPDTIRVPAEAVEFGCEGEPDEFFVIKLKDRCAMKIDPATVEGPALRRLIEEVRADRAGGDPNAYNRMYNRHNRSGGGAADPRRKPTPPSPPPEPAPEPEPPKKDAGTA